MNKIILAGGSGYLGSALINYFRTRAAEIIILGRKATAPIANIRTVVWDGKTPGPWIGVLEGADVIINLTGKSVDCRYTEKNKRIIYSSRLNATRAIGHGIMQCTNPPKIWINASSATIYNASFEKSMTEREGEIGNDFSMDVCQQWETAFNEFKFPHTRKLVLRTSIVLGKHGGALLPLKNLVKFGFGGKQGDGKQYCSWLHEYDFCRIVEWLIEQSAASGIYNVTAPTPVPNHVFMKSLRLAMGMPFGIPLSKPVLQVGALLIQTQSELILKSRKVIPERLLKAGFEFEFTTLDKALKDLI